MLKEIYLDNAAATPVDPRVQKSITQAMKLVGNPSSYNDAGRVAAEAINKARVGVARFLGCYDDEVVFTASGSEANSLAITGVAKVSDAALNEIITTPIEHKSVLAACESLKPSHKILYTQVNEQGLVSVKDIVSKITPQTLLVSVMYANNEIGTIQPIRDIAKAITQYRGQHHSEYPLLHVDACQAAGYLPMNVRQLGVDLLSFNGSKIYGPRGIGVLYVRRGVALAPLILGGGQEHGLRAGTENTPAIIGLATAVSLVKKDESAKLAKLRDVFFEWITRAMPDVRINGALGSLRLANNINVSIPGLQSEQLLIELDQYGIRAGSGSACTARSVEPSHVLQAIGTPKKYLDGAIRFSVGRHTKSSDIKKLTEILPKIVKKLRDRYRV